MAVSERTKRSNVPDWQTLVHRTLVEQLEKVNLSRQPLERAHSVASGMYSDVFSGTCTLPSGGQVKVAVKRLRLYERGDIKLLLEREIYVWSKLSHPNLHPLLGFSFDGETGYPILITKWMENGSAWQYVHQSPDYDIVLLIVGIARGLSYLHEKNVVHSDIKSDNILVSSSGEALICDFGCSRLISASQSLANLSAGPKGSIRYMAYELIAQPSNTIRFSKESDVWAFGMTIYELLTQTRPYSSYKLDVQVIAVIMRKELPAFPQTPDLRSTRSPDATKLLQSLCDKCWRHDPKDRIAMSSIVQNLNTITNRSFVSQTILAELAHLDLSGKICIKHAPVVRSGTFSELFSSTCTLSSNGEVKVAVKRLRLYERDGLKSFKKEIDIWSKLSHQNLLPLLGVSLDNETGYPMLVTKWMEDGSAWQYVHSRPKMDILPLVIGISEGLDYLHQRDVVHSDMKSDNVLVSSSGEALICDFGCGRMSLISAKTTSEPENVIRYLARELVQQPYETICYSKESDVWAFGMTVYELLILKRPYENMTRDQTRLAIISSSLPAFPDSPDLRFTERPEIGKLLQTICERCWKQDPGARVNMSDVVQMLKSSNFGPDGKETSNRPNLSRVLKHLSGALALAVAAGILSFVLRRRWFSSC